MGEDHTRLHQAELAHALRLSTMGEMAASLAHELNQPLQAIRNYAEGSVWRLRRMPEKDEPLIAALEQITLEATRAAEIIRGIRNFIDKRQANLAEVHINDLVREVLQLAHIDITRRDVKLQLDLGAGLPTVLADAIQVEQVIMNLVRNALEAMEDMPTPRRLLELRTSSDEKTVQVDVRDHGRGITKDQAERIFTPFTTTKLGGLGMGLAISRSIIQSHGGTLWAAFGDAEGCSFHFTLPRSKNS